MTRGKRFLSRTMLGLALGLIAAPALAQKAAEPAPGAEGEVAEGRPLDGYFATTALTGLILFLVAKSARR